MGDKAAERAAWAKFAEHPDPERTIGQYLAELEAAAEVNTTATEQAIAAVVKVGHSEHCARRIAWGDGECSCGRRAVVAAVARLLSEDEGAVLVHPGTNDETVRLDVPLDTWEELCDALTTEPTTGGPDAGKEEG